MLIAIDFQSNVPIYVQLRNQIVVGIAEGKLAPGEKLPTIRALADETGINMMTVSKAYQMLKRDGYIVTDRRNGAIVAPGRSPSVSDETINELKLKISELRLSGLSKDEILDLCSRLYEEGQK